MPRHVLLEGASLQHLHERVLAEHGRHARIISAERVMSGGIRGFFAKQHFEVTVELPDTAHHGVHRMDLPTRVGLAALLDDADAAETAVAEAVPEPDSAQPSTATPDFAALLRQMTLDTATPAVTPRGAELTLFPGLLPVSGSAFVAPVADVAGAISASHVQHGEPVPLSGPGDLMLCIGASADVFRLASEWADAAGALLVNCVPASVAAASTPASARDLSAPVPTISDRRDAAGARAAGVERGAACIAIVALSAAQSAPQQAAVLERERQLGTAASVLADQVWLVVDVSRKPDDTAAWVAACREALDVHGIVAIGRSETSTPDSVRTLGLPVLWHPKG